MQGEIFRIIFYHVPSASVAFCSSPSRWPAPSAICPSARNPALGAGLRRLGARRRRGRRRFLHRRSLTGPLWGRRAWGIWWTWDARLTTTLVLWLIYVSYLLLRRFAAGPQMQTLAAVLGIFGALDVPIVYMSNRWWRTQHPAPVFGGDREGSGMDPSMLPPSLEHPGLACLGHPHPRPALPRRAPAPEIAAAKPRKP
jgi:heme exporter protein C